jgi:hypothetical protein
MSKLNSLSRPSPLLAATLEKLSHALPTVQAVVHPAGPLATQLAAQRRHGAPAGPQPPAALRLKQARTG